MNSRVALIGVVLLALVAIGAAYTFGTHQRPEPVTAARVPFPDLRPPNSAPLFVPPGSTALFYGDSLTAGSFTGSDATTFRGLVTLRAGIGNAINASTKGIRTGSFLAEHPTAPAGVSLAVVELGTNDVGNTDPAAFDGSYGALLDSIRDANPDAGLVCLGPWRPTGVSAPYSAAIQRECVERGGRYIPLDVMHGQGRNRGPEGQLIQGESRRRR